MNETIVDLQKQRKKRDPVGATVINKKQQAEPSERTVCGVQFKFDPQLCCEHSFDCLLDEKRNPTSMHMCMLCSATALFEAGKIVEYDNMKFVKGLHDDDRPHRSSR